MSIPRISPQASLEQRLSYYEAVVEDIRIQVEKSTQKTGKLIAARRAQSKEIAELLASIPAQFENADQLNASLRTQTENSANKTAKTPKDTYVSLQDPSNETDTLGATTDEPLARARAQRERDKLLASMGNTPSVSSHDQIEKIKPHNDKTSAAFLTRLFNAIYAWFKSIFCKNELRESEKRRKQPDETLQTQENEIQLKRTQAALDRLTIDSQRKMIDKAKKMGFIDHMSCAFHLNSVDKIMTRSESGVKQPAWRKV
jgi:hypothetical protein